MSVEAIVWVLKQDIKPASAKHVLTVMANCANSIDFVCYPSIAYLTQATSQDRKTVIKNMAVLRQMGYIKDTGKLIGHTTKFMCTNCVSPPTKKSKPINSKTTPKVERVPKTELFQKRHHFLRQTVPFFP